MSETPHIRETSPVEGLARGRLTFFEVLAQSVAAVAPSAVMVTVPALVIPEAGWAAIPIFIVAAILAAAVGFCIGQFATRMVAVSGVYSYTVKGLGAGPGFVSGWSLLVGYGAISMTSILGAASYLTSLVGRIGVPTEPVTVTGFAGAVGIFALVLMIRGVKLSARIMLGVEVFAIVAATIVLVIAFALALGDGGPPTSGNDNGTGSAIGFALLLAVTSFGGFETAGTVAREAHKPLTTVPRAIRWTPGVLGLLFVFAVTMQIPGADRDRVGPLQIVLTLPDTVGKGPAVLAILMELGIAASWFACVMGSTTALSRTLFAMGREGILPTAFGRAHARFHTPHVALVVAMPIIVLVPVLALAVTGSVREVVIGLTALSAHGYVLAYILLCVATPVFLRRIGEMTRLPLIVGSVTALCLLGMIGWAAASGIYVAWTMTGTYLALMLAGLVLFFVQVHRTPQIKDRVGVYDETVAGDVLSRHNPWGVRG